MRNMFRGISLLVLFVCVQSTVAGKEADSERVKLRISTFVESPTQQISQNSILFSVLNSDDVRHIEYEPYRMSVRVVDKRSNEFSLVLSIFDESGTARDSVTVLATMETDANFAFRFDEVKISGVIRILEVGLPENTSDIAAAPQ